MFIWLDWLFSGFCYCCFKLLFVVFVMRFASGLCFLLVLFGLMGWLVLFAVCFVDLFSIVL